jgi:hypothetical protein
MAVSRVDHASTWMRTGSSVRGSLKNPRLPDVERARRPVAGHGIKVRPKKLKRAGADGKVLQMTGLGAATNCGEGSLDHLYAHSYAHASPG